MTERDHRLSEPLVKLLDEAIEAEVVYQRGLGSPGDHRGHDIRRRCAREARQAVLNALEAEREACAKACEEYERGDSWKNEPDNQLIHKLTARWCAALCRNPDFRQHETAAVLHHTEDPK